jgi:hypothetical protein
MNVGMKPLKRWEREHKSVRDTGSGRKVDRTGSVSCIKVKQVKKKVLPIRAMKAYGGSRCIAPLILILGRR